MYIYVCLYVYINTYIYIYMQVYIYICNTNMLYYRVMCTSTDTLYTLLTDQQVKKDLQNETEPGIVLSLLV